MFCEGIVHIKDPIMNCESIEDLTSHPHFPRSPGAWEIAAVVIMERGTARIRIVHRRDTPLTSLCYGTRRPGQHVTSMRKPSALLENFYGCESSVGGKEKKQHLERKKYVCY